VTAPARRTSRRRTYLLIDYLSLFYRAFYSMPDTVHMHGVHGFLSMLARLIGDRRPTDLVIAIDEDWRPAFRVAAIPSYKTHRVVEESEEGEEGEEGEEADPVLDQEAIGREVLAAVGIAVAGAPGYEAEDVIATLIRGARARVEIVSGDRDLFALVRDPDVRVLYPTKGVSTLAEIDEGEIERRYDIPGRAYADYAILRGDPSDGLPGVRGIGEKTASQLIRAYGSLAGVEAARDLPAPIARKVDGAREYLQAAREVVYPVEDAPVRKVVTRLPRKAAHPRTLTRLAAEYQLEGPVRRLLEALTAAP